MQPYEKCITYGSESLSDAELLAVMIRTGTREMDSVAVGEEILKASQGLGLRGLFHLSVRELMKIPGIGEVKAVRMKCIAEFALRISRAEALQKLNFGDPSTVANYYMESMRNLEREHVIMITLDSRNRKIQEMLVSVGTVSEAMLSPREVFREALRGDAVSIILLHNHPSGDPTPSEPDIDVTRKMKELGKMMSIPLLDHIVIGDNCYYSFMQEEQL